MTPSTSDTSTGTTAALLTPSTSENPARHGSSSGFSSSVGSSGARDRLQRVSGALHTAIDKVEQGLSSRTGGLSGQAGLQAGSLTQQINARPLRSAGIALGAAVILKKLFGSSRSPEVKVVQVPVPVRVPMRSSLQPVSYTRAQLRSLRGTGQGLFDRAGAAAYMGKERAKTLGYNLTRSLGTLPQQMRMASRGVQARTQQYGSMARVGVQEHPLAGLAAVTGAAALATALWRQRSRGSYDSGYVAVDGSASGLDRQYGWQDGPSGARGMISARPVVSALVMVGIAALAGTVLRRNT